MLTNWVCRILGDQEWEMTNKKCVMYVDGGHNYTVNAEWTGKWTRKWALPKNIVLAIYSIVDKRPKASP